ncbi:MAG: polysaccharide pyruvyl transferase family protein [Ilumatobacteraceae bacterium]
MASGNTRRIAFFGLFGGGNVGNEGSLAAAIDAVRTRDAATDIVVVCARPAAVAMEHGVRAVPISMAGRLAALDSAPRPIRMLVRPITEVARWVAAFRFVRSVDAIVVPGTGILDDFGESWHQMPYAQFRWSTAARLARRPWMMVGVGAGPIDHRVSRWLMRRTVRNSRTITYRDEGSRAFMAGIGVPSPATSVQPDLAFALPRPADRRPPDHTGTDVGLGVMAYYGWRNDPADGEDGFDRYVDAMTEIAGRLLARGHTIRVLVGAPSDQAAVERVVAALERDHPEAVAAALTITPIKSFAELLDEVARTDVVVGTRYHNVIAGLMMSRPTVAVAYAGKFRDVMAQFGLDDFCHDVDELVADAVVADIETVLARSSEIAAQLDRHNRRYSRAVADRFDAVFDDVLGGDR